MACPDRELGDRARGDHIDRLYRAARSLCDSRHDAEDLVQETIALALRRPRKLRPQPDVPYLLALLRDTFISTRETATGRSQTRDQSATIKPLDEPNSSHAEDGSEGTHVYRAIGALPANFRDAVVAIDVVGLSYRQAARTLRVRRATVTTRLYRGRLLIARALA